MRLNKLLNIGKGSMVSIVGAGGKTTFMYTLADELRKDRKCLITTTTKIYQPDKKNYDFIALYSDNFDSLKQNSTKGIYVYGSSINSEGKLIGVNPSELLGQLTFFDNILIEADGSKMKMIKGWLDTEPVVCAGSTHTVGIISIEAIGKVINEGNVHRIKEFINITNAEMYGLITKENIASVILHPSGLFKNAEGEKILFINKAESLDQISEGKKLADFIRANEKSNLILDRIIIGSLKNKIYMEL